jgi:hypothetical protein
MSTLFGMTSRIPRDGSGSLTRVTLLGEWYNSHTKENNMDCQECEDQYPIKLSFTCPHTGEAFEREMNDEAQADDVFHWFFSKWGYEVPYSVDEVRVPAATVIGVSSG